MKKLNLLFITILSVSALNAQDITDALRYSQDEIQGSARFRALSGAFGALGGDMSAVNINPAGSAVFSQSHASFSLSNVGIENDTRYFNGSTTNKDSSFDLNQGGAAFVFENRSNSPWRKFTLGIAYDRTNNYDNTWNAVGTNTNNNSIDRYFLNYADGKRLGDIKAMPNEPFADAYSDIGNVFGFGHQQAFLGYESFIIQPDDINDDDNTTYFSNLVDGDFQHDYLYTSTGYNGKIAFNFATQYQDNLYLGINLNSHFIDYRKSTSLIEDTSAGSTINRIDFDNSLSTTGSGFSFQLGGIVKISPEFRVGLTFDSPTWYTIEEETTQSIATFTSTDTPIRINPGIVNIYPQYKLQTPSKLTGSLAYIFGKQGLISFDYSRKDYGNTKFKPTNDYSGLNNDMNSLLTNPVC